MNTLKSIIFTIIGVAIIVLGILGFNKCNKWLDASNQNNLSSQINQINEVHNATASSINNMHYSSIDLNHDPIVKFRK